MAEPCGAKTRSGGTCKKPGYPKNGRCRFHGGLSTGPKSQEGNKNAFKHGIYGSYFTDQEVAEADASPLDSVEDELRVCKIRLKRALALEGSADLELEEVIERHGGGEFVPHLEKKSRRRDYGKIIEAMLLRIESLTKTRAALLEAGGGPDDRQPDGYEVVPYE